MLWLEVFAVAVAQSHVFYIYSSCAPPLFIEERNGVGRDVMWMVKTVFGMESKSLSCICRSWPTTNLTVI